MKKMGIRQIEDLQKKNKTKQKQGRHATNDASIMCGGDTGGDGGEGGGGGDGGGSNVSSVVDVL